MLGIFLALSPNSHMTLEKPLNALQLSFFNSKMGERQELFHLLHGAVWKVKGDNDY